MSLTDDFVSALEKAAERAGNLNKLSEMSGIKYPTLFRWIKKQQTPSLESVEKLMSFMDGWPYNTTTGESPDEALAAECQRLRAENVGLRKAVTDLQLAKARLEGQLDLLKEMIGEKKPEVFD